MNVAVALTITLSLGQLPAVDNPILEELVKEGIKTSDGARFRLPAPTIAAGMDAAAQRAAIDKLLAGSRATFADLTSRDYQAPFILNIPTLRKPDGKSAVRSVDLWFIAHGDWKTATSKEFLESFWKAAEERAPKRPAGKVGALTEAELAKRKIDVKNAPGREEQFVHTSVDLFDRVRVSATQHGILNRQDAQVLVAQKIDPRFTDDPEYPNQWRSLEEADGEMKAGPPHPYTAAGSYAFATPLAEPKGAILFEYHMIFEEPEEWFGGVNLVRSKLPLAVQDQLRHFRRKLATADGL